MLALFVIMAIMKGYVLIAIADNCLFDRYLKQKRCSDFSWTFDDLTDEIYCSAAVTYYFTNLTPSKVCNKSCEFPGNCIYSYKDILSLVPLHYTYKYIHYVN